MDVDLASYSSRSRRGTYYRRGEGEGKPQPQPQGAGIAGRDIKASTHACLVLKKI